MVPTVLLYNGQLLPEADFSLKLPNRGLFFNDGFFETLVWADGHIRYLAHHVARMQRAAAALHLTLPPELATPEQLSATLMPLATTLAPAAARLRLQFWRAGAGLYTPTTSGCEWLATAQPFAALDAPIQQAAFARTITTQPSPVAFCKGPYAQVYVLAAQERAQRGLDEVVLLSPAGYVAETVSAAIGWVRGTTIFTPAAAAGVVAGVRMAHLRSIARQVGLAWQEELFLPADILQAEAVFTANIAGVRPVQQLEEATFTSVAHPVLAQLSAAEKAAR